ncbi:MAG: methylenetetrahydrofolate reductase [Dehalococcoidia bacterium]|nr:methylenetetrahydrofolate reductase [Dehalococcoidia bacterium]
MTPSNDITINNGDFLKEPRFELIPMKGVEDQAQFLPDRAMVAVTASPSKGLDATFKLAETMAARGFRVVPHLAARLVRSREHLEELVDRYEEDGFDELFVIGGDETEPAGPYHSATLLLKDMQELPNRPKRIGIGSYPDGHPLISRDELFKALQDKQPMADYMITQICFDQKKISAWLSDMRKRGINLPVYIGIPGVLKRQKLLDISLKVGVGDSTRFIMHNLGLAARLLGSQMYTPDKLVKQAISMSGDKTNDIAGFHIYTFNQCQTTEQWHQKCIKT